MISPSRRKLPITRPNTPTFASALGWALAGLALVAPCAAPLSAQEAVRPVERRVTRPAEAPVVKPRNGLPPLYLPSENGSAAAPPLSATKAKGRKPADAAATLPAPGKSAPAATASARPVKKPLRAVRPVAYDESAAGAFADEPVEPLPQLDEQIPRLDELADNSNRLAPQQTYEPVPADDADLAARRARLRAQLTRPFKQIREIRPFFDYEPDAEQLAQDRCFNLCPRPGSPDCPECDQAGPDGAPRGSLPCPECPVEIDLRETARIVGSVNDFPTRNFPHISYCWEPTNLYAYPLYFEDFTLERYGHTRHYLLQAPFSVGLFAAQFIGLPYQITIDPIAKRRYALGWYRPGQYVPYKYYQVPWNTEAALVEAGVLTGAVFLFSPGLGP